MSLYTVVSRGVAGRLGPRPAETGQATGQAAAGNSVRLTGASMRVLESGLAFIAFATAILIGIGR